MHYVPKLTAKTSKTQPKEARKRGPQAGPKASLSQGYRTALGSSFSIPSQDTIPQGEDENTHIRTSTRDTILESGAVVPIHGPKDTEVG